MSPEAQAAQEAARQMEEARRAAELLAAEVAAHLARLHPGQGVQR
ncbi:hypothetical protein [Streptomyces sp. AC550_RSS872]|nr:hypothetical protein [Streptomyces sp. AC550_RSS872]